MGHQKTFYRESDKWAEFWRIIIELFQSRGSFQVKGTMFSKTINKYGTLRGPKPGKHQWKMKSPSGLWEMGKDRWAGAGRKALARRSGGFFFFNKSVKPNVFSKNHLVFFLNYDSKPHTWNPDLVSTGWGLWSQNFKQALHRILINKGPNFHSILKEINPAYSLEGLVLKLKLKFQYSGYLMQRNDSLEKILLQGRMEGKEEKGTRENEMVGWHHQLNGHEFAQTQGNSEEQGSLGCCSPWGCLELDRLSDWTTVTNFK